MANRGFKIPVGLLPSLINIIGLTDAQNWLVCLLVVGQMVVHSADVEIKLSLHGLSLAQSKVDFMQSFLTSSSAFHFRCC